MSPRSKRVTEVPDLASIDPPNFERTYLEVPFAPNNDANGYTQDDFIRAAMTAPFNKLPRILVPREEEPMRPPKMHYGWEADVEGLLKYAEDHGIVRYYTEYPLRSGEGEVISEPTEQRESTEEALRRVDEYMTVLAAVRDIAQSLGVPFPEDILEIANTPCMGGADIISLYTNYELDEAPSEAFVEAFRERLEYKDKPKWYIDDSYWKWKRRS